MNKKTLILLIVVFVMIFSISEVFAITNEETHANDILNKDNNNDSVLVVYFSRTGENYQVGNVEVGNTAMIASYIKEYLNADSFEIVPKEKYPGDYEQCTQQASTEQKNNARPEIENKIDDFKSYDTVFIGYPIWWGDLPMIMYTFLEDYDFTDKTVIPFNTHEGSGDSGTYLTIENKLPSANVNTNGFAIDGKTARSEDGKAQTIEWLKELGY